MAERADVRGAPRSFKRRAIRWLLLVVGGLSVAVGIVGIFVPLLPSFEFFLLAAVCFGRSSPAAYRWLTTNRVFGKRFSDYKDQRGATIATKLVTLSMLWAGMGASVALLQPPFWLDALLAAVAIGVAWHVLSLKTMRG